MGSEVGFWLGLQRESPARFCEPQVHGIAVYGRDYGLVKVLYIMLNMAWLLYYRSTYIIPLITSMVVFFTLFIIMF